MDDSDFLPNSLQPSTSKNLTKKSKSSSDVKASIDSDCLLPDSDKDRCYICNKDLRHLNEIRKSLHINNCLDQQESKTKFATETEKWTNTLDCPMCGEPLQPGPYRAAHAKRCGKKHNVPAARLLVLMETQSQVAEMRKKNGMPHTKLNVPKLEVKKPSRLKEEPRSVFEEQMKTALAMSASMDSSSDSFVEVLKEAPIVKPVRKGDSRKSYSFLELEPRSCKCAIFEQIQENFVNKFKVKRYANFRQMMRSRRQRSSALLRDLNMCIHKLERLERLADDLRKHARSGGDVAVYSKDDAKISVHRFILAARAPLMAALIDKEGSLYMKDYSAASIRCYIQFLYSSSMEWTDEEKSEVLELAARFGPPELVQCCKVSAVMTERVYNEEAEEMDFFVASDCKVLPEMTEAVCSEETKGMDSPATVSKALAEMTESANNEEMNGMDLYAPGAKVPTERTERAHSEEMKVTGFPASSCKVPAKRTERVCSEEIIEMHFPASSSKAPAVRTERVCSKEMRAVDFPAPGCKVPAKRPERVCNEEMKRIDFPAAASKVSTERTTRLFNKEMKEMDFVASGAQKIKHSDGSRPPTLLKELGPHVKILKTSDVTPMPAYEQMTEKELKDELAKFGLRPLGKRKAVEMLWRIYEGTHPVMGDASPISSRKRSKAIADELKEIPQLVQENRSGVSEDATDEADCTLNVSLDEDKIQEESAMDLAEEHGPLPKDLDGMQSALLGWLRRDENEELYNHLLTLNPISFDEFADRLSRSDSAAATIPKKALIEILDRLHITFRLPADGWKRRHQKAKLKK